MPSIYQDKQCQLQRSEGKLPAATRRLNSSIGSRALKRSRYSGPELGYVWSDWIWALSPSQAFGHDCMAVASASSSK